MQALNAAMALLAGTDVSALTVPQIERVTMYEDLTTRQTAGDPTSGISLTMSITVGPLHAADWIYAANFGEGGRLYLAGYSGRIVEIAPDGNPVRAYDIAAVPRHVAETPQYLYLLTDTRLYVLRGDQLVALLDVFEGRRGKDLHLALALRALHRCDPQPRSDSSCAAHNGRAGG
jgi:hypothetical protein